MSKGTIFQLEKDKPKSKCRKWKLQISAGRDLATGKYRRLFRNVTGSYSEAQEELRRFQDEIGKGKVVKKSSIRFEDYAQNWLDKRKLTHAHGTWRKNVDHIKCANLHIADARLTEVTPFVLETMYVKLQQGESPSGRKLSGTYTECIARTLHKLFRDAQTEGLIAKNPCDSAEKPRNDTPERRSLAIDDIHELIEKLDPAQPTQLVILMGLKAGICRAEAHGLCWGDIDRDTIHIRHNFDTGGNLKSTKVRKRTRDLPLTTSLKSDFAACRQSLEDQFAHYNSRILEECERVGRPVNPGELLRITDETPVICNTFGERMLPSSSTRWWTRNRDELGFSNWTIHDMRHSYLSELARRKVPLKTLQELAGHEKGSTTMDIYLHANDDDKRNAVKLVDW